MTPEIFTSFTLIEWVLFGFIGANVAIVGICLVHNGFKRLGHHTEE
ncbi:hypothetical protein [Hyphococcus luteus]|nr:hypothetical protein [Marinicaulis flavus]